MYKFNQLTGKNYKNCRTAIIGLLGKSDGYLFKAEDNNKGGNQNNNAEPFVKGATPKDGEGSPQTNLSKAEQFAKGLATAHNSAVKNSAESIYFGE